MAGSAAAGAWPTPRGRGDSAPPPQRGSSLVSPVGRTRSFRMAALATGPPVCQRQVVPKWYHNSVAMNLRLDEEDSALLKALAEAEHVSLHEAALRAIRRSAREVAHTARVREATAEMLDLWGEVLDRLGQA